MVFTNFMIKCADFLNYIIKVFIQSMCKISPLLENMSS